MQLSPRSETEDDSLQPRLSINVEITPEVEQVTTTKKVGFIDKDTTLISDKKVQSIATEIQKNNIDNRISESSTCFTLGTYNSKCMVKTDALGLAVESRKGKKLNIMNPETLAKTQSYSNFIEELLSGINFAGKLFLGCENEKVFVYNVETKKAIVQLTSQKNVKVMVPFNENLILCGEEGGIIEVIDATTNKMV